MQPLSEAKQFVALHARHMGFRQSYLDDVLGCIDRLSGEAAGSWLAEWEHEASIAEARNQLAKAANLFNLARFPCADEPAKQAAARRCARVYERQLALQGGEKRYAQVAQVRVPFLFQAGKRPDAPLVVLMGGIVSMKEQWGGFLKLGHKLGCAVAIADFPGVGENMLPYSRASAAVFGGLLDACADACAVKQTLVVAPSFGGHLAILHAQLDQRIRKVVTVGAPLSAFFLDPGIRARAPSITRAALMFAARTDEAGLERELRALALCDEDLSSLRVQVTYVASLGDEIIPQAEWRHAAALAPAFQVYAFDDVHGAPNHLLQTRLIIVSELLRAAGRARLARVLAGLGRHALQIQPLSSQPEFV